MDLAPILARIDAQRAEIDALRPLPADQLGRAMQRLRLEWTYHSNAIEGNQLTYGETRALLLHGVTAQGKPLKDHLDIKGHREALDYLERFVQSKEPLALTNVRELHRLLLGDTYEIEVEEPDGRRSKRTKDGGAFKDHPNNVRTATGEIHYYATPEETPARMTDLIDWLRDEQAHVEDGTLHPVVYAAAFHHRFVAIHPFPDGNGRMARLLMNLVLMRAGYVPAVVRQQAREAYYGVLAQADGGELEPFTAFVADELAATMTLFLRALRGEPDPDEFDRRIALLEQEAKGMRRTAEASVWSVNRSREAHECVVVPLWKATQPRMRQVARLFEETKVSISIYSDESEFGRHFDETTAEDALSEASNGSWRQMRILWFCKGYLAGGLEQAVPVGFSVRMEDRFATLAPGISLFVRPGVYSWKYPGTPSLTEVTRFASEFEQDVLTWLDTLQARADQKLEE
ncbi:MAG: Fic family protein [Bacteroidota bacterium]